MDEKQVPPLRGAETANTGGDISVIAWACNAFGRCAYVDPLWLILTGQSQDQAAGGGWMKAAHPDDITHIEEAFRAAHARQAPFRIEFRVRSADGAYRYVMVVSAPRFDESGAFAGYLGSMIDIDARRRAEDAARESEERQAFLLAFSDALRPLAKPVEIQAAACRMLGEHLGVNRVAYADIVSGDFIVGPSFTRGVAPFVWRGPVAAFGQTLLEAYRRGETVAVADVASDPRFTEAERQTNRSLQIAAFVGSMLMKDGRWVGAFVCHNAVPRVWTRSEIELVREVAERIWAAAARAHVEDALRKTQESLTFALEASKMRTWDLDLTRDFSERHSLRHDEIFGFEASQADWGAEIARRHVVEDDREIFDAAFARAKATGELEFEVRVRWPDGGLHWVAVLGRFYFDARKNPIRGAGVNFDVTERKQAEAALRESEERFRSLFETSRDGVVTVDMQGRILEANPAYQAMVGYTIDELRRLSYQDITPARWHEMEDAVVADRILAHGDSGEYEKEYIRKDGHIFPISLRTWPVRDAKGRPVAMRAFVRDITERKQAETALYESESRFRAVFQHAGTGVAITDWAGRFEKANSAYRRLTGYSENELQQLNLADLVHPDDRAVNFAEIRRLQDEELPFFEIENRYLRKDGGVVWVHKFVSLLRDDKGAPTHIVALVSDVTERRRMEQELRDADRRKDEFLATLAHELRNPLAPIHNALHVLRRTLGDDSAGRAAPLIAMMTRQVEHLVRLVDDLVEVSRISRGKIELRKEPVELAGVLRDAVETCQPLIAEKRHRVTMRLPAQPLRLDADAMRLSQVFTNLVNNAAKFTKPGGRIEIEAEQRGAEAVARVRDDGSGIEPQMLPHVFDLFAQAGDGGARAKSGLGIGLALARKLIELHGGRIEAQSGGPGAGSMFTVYLPLLSPGGIAAAKEKPASCAAELPVRVLLVDDNHDVTDSLALLLSTFAADVRVAYDGFAGLDALASFEPDLVLLDLGMPKMDGYETARRMRELPHGAHATLVALTGWGQDEDRARTREAGFDLHLTKPASLEALTDLLRQSGRPA